MRVLRLVFYAAWLLAGFVATLDADEPKDRFTVFTTETILHGQRAAALGDDWALRLDPSLGGLVEMQREGMARPASPTRHFVHLTHGDEVPIDTIKPVRLAEGRLTFTPVAVLGGEGWSVYLPYVSFLVREMPGPAEEVEVLFAKLRHDPRPRDLILLRDGDRVEGEITSLDSVGACQVREAGRTVRVAWENVAVVAFRSDRQARPRLRKTHGHVVLRDGVRLLCRSLQPDGASHWAGRTWFGASVRIAVERVVNLGLLAGPADYLDDLEPAAVTVEPYLSIGWPITRQRNVANGPLRLGPDTFDRGLGVHAPAKVAFDLKGNYHWFDTAVGLDASAGRLGRARLAVLVDGVLHDVGSKELDARGGPQRLRLNVRGAKTLTLLAEPGGLGDVRAHVDWADARLVKAGR